MDVAQVASCRAVQQGPVPLESQASDGKLQLSQQKQRKRAHAALAVAVVGPDAGRKRDCQGHAVDDAAVKHGCVRQDGVSHPEHG